ncbi:MAG TPA: hypothetical protein VET88_11310 [Gammaproteobacteria bacterium]|nr:hypothetical protein [Gammaproteobacteria bacterium]
MMFDMATLAGLAITRGNHGCRGAGQQQMKNGESCRNQQGCMPDVKTRD